MSIVYKFNSDIPYSLHDMRVVNIECEGNDLHFIFDYGYVECVPPYDSVDGSLVIKGIDEDFCFVYLLSKNGELGSFSGEKLLLQDFFEKYKNYSFEIVDETYGYNQVVYNGYLSLIDEDEFVEVQMSIYYFGEIEYITENKKAYL